MHSRWRSYVLCALGLVAAAAAGCDKVPLTAPGGSTITVTAERLAVPLGGATQVTASVIEQAGTPVQNGTTVRFTTTLGRVEPAEAQTRNGLAVVTFHAGDASGIAEIRATSGPANGGGGTATTPATNSVQISVGAAAAGSVLLGASPAVVPSSGGTVSITASVLDTAGNRMAAVPVTFSASAGTLSATSALTDGNGDARVTLTTTSQSVVTARVGSGADQRTATVTVNVAAANNLTLSVSPSSPAAGQPVTLTITPTVGANNVAPVVTINWGDGSEEHVGTVSAARTVSHTYEQPGAYTITATGVANGEAVVSSIGVVVGQRAGVSVTASPTSGTVATVFTFTITPAAGTRVENVVIAFGDGTSIALGAIGSATTVTKQYTTSGQKIVTVTQTNTDSSTSVATVVVTVT